MPHILVYSSGFCGYCVAAKNFLTQRGLSFEEIRVDRDPDKRREMLQRSQRTSVPQIFVGDHHVGGYQDMMAMDRAGTFTPLLSD